MTINSMCSTRNLIGMTILSRETGNKLGNISDLYIDPIEGLLLGVEATRGAEAAGCILRTDIYSFGEDAVMATGDDAIRPPSECSLVGVPRAKRELIGTKVITEGGKLLGRISSIYICFSDRAYAVYEIRDSVLDKLLGRGFFLQASMGRAFSDDSERIIVPDDATERAGSSLESLIDKSFTRPQFVYSSTADSTAESLTAGISKAASIN